MIAVLCVTEAKYKAATCFSGNGWMDLGPLGQRDEDLAMTELIAEDLRK